MDKNGQMTFSDDPLLQGSNEAYQLIEEGQFTEAVKKIDGLLNINPDYPGLTEGYRTAKFWQNRTDEISRKQEGKERADFLMTQWEEFKKYTEEKKIAHSAAYHASMRHVFFKASENYKKAFKNQESTTDNFDLLLNLGVCFLTLGEYGYTIETLEYARSSTRSSAKLLSLLGEAYYHTGEVPRSLLFLKEAFFINPSEIDLNLLKAKPVQDLLGVVREKRPDAPDPREWIPIYGFLEDVFYVKRQLNSQQLEGIKRDTYNLDASFRTMSREKIDSTSVMPRLINKYLWLLDYYEFQKYDFQIITEIRDRLKQIDRDLFEEYFKKKEKK